MAAAVASSMLMRISFQEAKGIIDQTRNVSFAKGEQRMEGAWIDRVIQEGVTCSEIPTGFSCCLTDQFDVVVHATTSIEGGTEPICHWKKGAAGKRDFKGITMTVETVEMASIRFGGRFCVNCQALLRASLRLEVEQLFG